MALDCARASKATGKQSANLIESNSQTILLELVGGDGGVEDKEVVKETLFN